MYALNILCAAILLCVINIDKSYAYYNNVIDVDDILSADYMPETLMVLENPEKNVNTFNETTYKEDPVKRLDGSFFNAMETMGYHRHV